MRAALLFTCCVVVSCSRTRLKIAAVDSAICTSCHPGIAKTYRATGMARSFNPASVDNAPAGALFQHVASQTTFQMVRRDGAAYLRHWQVGPGGREESVEELKVDYVMGSGNHARTYLHKTERGTLIELPLAWYAEKGGTWAMNPGYDAVHWPARRKVGYDCMFCHNAYPSIAAGHEDAGAEPVFSGALPEGIDCQRCHGPGAEHVRIAQTSDAKAEAIAAAILNPKRLSPERSMEVCAQCHLETTSFALPNAIRRFDQRPFSYNPREPLSGFILFFDHARGTGNDEKFEIVNSVYRLRQSRCFLASAGALSCTTCHDPHAIPRGREATAHYNGVCRNCHAQLTGHTEKLDCVSCHMPKRRTEDVVHAVMTDHKIQRRDPSGALAVLSEKHPEYRGEVVPYGAAVPVYTADAQVSAKSNLGDGITRLEGAIALEKPARAEFYLELGDAWKNASQPAKAVAPYQEALRIKPNSALVMRRLAAALQESGGDGTEMLQRAVKAEPDNAEAWYELGLSKSDSVVLAKAVALDSGMAEAHNTLGAVLAEKGLPTEAEASFRRALQIDPTLAGAHANLANLLSVRPDPSEAAWHFEMAVRFAPENALYRFNYAAILVRMNRNDEAQRQVEASVKADDHFAEAHDLLGGILELRGRARDALKEYRQAVALRPDFGKALLDLGTVLANTGDTMGAVEQFRKAAAGADPQIRQQAQQSLAQLGK